MVLTGNGRKGRWWCKWFLVVAESRDSARA